ncbi:MAG: hypothetical protein IJT52_06995 [Spirochaetales bacterium]|nr:hypothetical protein [Spirochaetales bacterium]
MIRITDLFDLEHTIAADYLKGFEYPWEALSGIKQLIIDLGKKLDPQEYTEVSENVWIHKTAKVFPSAYIGGPCIIGPETEVRHCAFIRSSALVGRHCVIGNSVEIKNAIIFDDCQVPHFNYVGDSILGYHAHLGAGSITSNIKADKKNILIHADQDIVTGLRKVGAMLGDWADVGSNCVLNPGVVIGRHTNVYPSSCVRGVIPADSIYKTGGVIVKKEER